MLDTLGVRITRLWIDAIDVCIISDLTKKYTEDDTDARPMNFERNISEPSNEPLIQQTIAVLIRRANPIDTWSRKMLAKIRLHVRIIMEKNSDRGRNDLGLRRSDRPILTIDRDEVLARISQSGYQTVCQDLGVINLVVVNVQAAIGRVEDMSCLKECSGIIHQDKVHGAIVRKSCGEKEHIL